MEQCISYLTFAETVCKGHTKVSSSPTKTVCSAVERDLDMSEIFLASCNMQLMETAWPVNKLFIEPTLNNITKLY